MAAAEFHPILTTAAAPDYAWLRNEDHRVPAAAPLTATSGGGAQAYDSQPSRRVSYQKSLFESQVLQFPPAPGMEKPRGRRRPPGTATRSHREGAGGGGQEGRRYVHARNQGKNAFQQSFEFQLVDEESLVLPQQDCIYCESPVAQPVHRLLAAALDFSMIIIALGLFLTTFHLMGGTVVLNGMTAALYGGIGVVLWFFYAALYSICGADTPGMVWMGLRLVNFDGDRPDREQRIYRMLGSVLGFLSAGLGLIWSLVDEEQLTWHDHISKTFPSPVHG